MWVIVSSGRRGLGGGGAELLRGFKQDKGYIKALNFLRCPLIVVSFFRFSRIRKPEFRRIGRLEAVEGRRITWTGVLKTGFPD